jgi:2-aminoadipate transaminase
MLGSIRLDSSDDLPLYRQLQRHLRTRILTGALAPGQRLPATRELAQDLGVNRATVSSAYALLEEEGLIQGHVGRGSFVAENRAEPTENKAYGVDWNAVGTREPETSGFPLPSRPALVSTAASEISFATSRPLTGLFPIEEFRECCQEVLGEEVAQTVLQLGSPLGYAPLRQFLMETAEQRGIGRSNDDILITNGCQQAIDLIARVLLRDGESVAVEEPLYPGLKASLQQAGARLVGVPVGEQGIDPVEFERILQVERPRFAAISPNFQNPTGATLPREAREQILAAAQRYGVVLVENDLYGDLRYRGESLPAIKAIDPQGDTVLLGSFSKVAFPGLRVGWVIGPRPLIRRLALVKQATDLHTDQLSQAVLLRFAESGRLARHLERVLQAGLEQLEVTVAGCRRYLPAGSQWTVPDGGLNLWVRLPEPLNAQALLSAAQMRGVSYLPARFFSVNRAEENAFRLSFGGLTPGQIERGLQVLGELFHQELERGNHTGVGEMATALV